MLLQELNDLKEGDQVVYVDQRHPTGSILGFPNTGTILTRKKCWMDDDLCSMFTYGEGVGDFHYFRHDQVEFIETGIKE